MTRRDEAKIETMVAQWHDPGGAAMDVRHGASKPVPVEVFLSADPDLALVNADMDAWAEAHPCECEAFCECDE